MEMQPRPESLWTASHGPARVPLSGDATVDVAVVGGGIVGLTAASLLQREGRRVAVIEARSVGRQTTGGSSAKVTAQHSLIYTRLTHTFGSDTARVYAQANASALDWIASRVASRGIRCSFERHPAYVFTEDAGRIDDLKEESRIAASLGLPARFTGDVPLPVPAVGAVVFDDQAQFDPYAYVLSEAQHFVDAGGLLFEDTRVNDVDTSMSRPRVVTERGTVSASDVVLATNLPILDHGRYYARAFPIAHLAIAARVGGEAPDGVFISVDQPTHSLRWHRDQRGDLWMLALGPRFRPGTEDTEQRFRELEAWARAYFPIASVEYRWWNEDFQSADGIPYVGRLSADIEHLYVATGFSGWGITNGVVAAQILADTIAGRPNEWAKTFDSTRSVRMDSAGELIRGNLPSVKAWVTDHLKHPHAVDLSTLGTDEGLVVEVGGKATGVSRDAEGALHAVSAECSHRGCILGWNGAMCTWDCSCHGSSFDRDGHVLRGPAVSNLEPRSITASAAGGVASS